MNSFIKHYDLTLQDVSDITFTLGIPRKSIIRFYNYLVFFDNYNWSPGEAPTCNITIYIKDYNHLKNKPFIEADELAKQFLRILGFLYNINFVRCMDSGHIRYSESVVQDILSEPLINKSNKNKNLKKIDRFNELMTLLHTNDLNKWETGMYAIKFYSKALELLDHELEEEAFFSAFKALEFITNHVYSKVYKDAIKKDINNTVAHFLNSHFDEKYQDKDDDKKANDLIVSTLTKIVSYRRKLKLTLTHLNINPSDRVLKELAICIKLRNTTAGHGNNPDKKGDNETINYERIMGFLDITKKAISHFLLGNEAMCAYLTLKKDDTWLHELQSSSVIDTEKEST